MKLLLSVNREIGGKSELGSNTLITFSFRYVYADLASQYWRKLVLKLNSTRTCERICTPYFCFHRRYSSTHSLISRCRICGRTFYTVVLLGGRDIILKFYKLFQSKEKSCITNISHKLHYLQAENAHITRNKPTNSYIENIGNTTHRP